MGLLLKLLGFTLKWLLPFTVSVGLFVMFVNIMEERYRKSNLDIFWRKTIRWGVGVGLVAILLAVIIHSQPYANAMNAIHLWAIQVQQSPWFGSIMTGIIMVKNWIKFKWLFWWPYYWRAISITIVFGSIVEIFALNWRISFWRAFNVIWPEIISFPLILGYFVGYQTPLKDQLLERKLKAKLRENLNDSYEAAVQGFDERGKAFEDGAGGTARTQTLKAVSIAMKRTQVRVKTTADGQRTAHILIRQSRETETDRAIEQALKGLGERISGDSIYFPSDPTFSPDSKGYVFDSVVHYQADEELGSYMPIFSNPFNQYNKVAEGGNGAFKTYLTVLKNNFAYIGHLSPYAIYTRAKAQAELKFYRDTSADKAKYKVQQNLDLSVVPTPVDVETGNDINTQRRRALEVANARVQDVTTALSGFGLYGQFKDVKVGGNQAIYEYTLPPDAKLPSDFNKVQDQIGNILRINDKPIITLNAGILSLSMNNGVNIPVSFTDMIKERKKGSSVIMSGMAGVDAMGQPIYVELGDKNPHMILFGKTGTGKTVTIMTILYSIMSATDPTKLRIAFVDGKGNSFEFMRADGDHPNPFVYAPPADASGDIDYARAIIINMEKETRRRIDLFKKMVVSKLAVYNQKMVKEGHPERQLPEILFVCDEFSAITQQDKQLSAKDSVKLNTVDRFEYIAKMARSVGVRMLMANQSARKELVPGKISANITGRVSLGVSEPIEAEIALPETGIKVNLISQAGEFYSIMNGPNNPEHGNSPYLPDDVMNALNDGLTRKFGKCEYMMTKEEIMETAGLGDNEGQAVESSIDSVDSTDGNAPTGNVIKISDLKVPTGVDVNTTLDKLQQLDESYYPFLSAHIDLVLSNTSIRNAKTDLKRKRYIAQSKAFQKKINRYIEDNGIEIIDDRKPKTSHKSTGEMVSHVVNDHSNRQI